MSKPRIASTYPKKTAPHAFRLLVFVIVVAFSAMLVDAVLGQDGGPDHYVCGNNVCDSNESAESCAVDCKSVARFYELLDRVKSDRASDNVGTRVLDRGELYKENNAAGDRMTEFVDETTRKTRDLSNLVMMDNTIGKVYPGSLLWAAPVRDGQLHQLEQIPGRPPVTTSFTVLRRINPEPSALVFEHDGSFSSFLSGAASVFGAKPSDGMRLAADFKVSSSLDDALLSIGLSAKAWGATMEAGMTQIKNEQRSIAVMTFDQVLYSAAVDAPPPAGFVPRRLLRENAELAGVLARGARSNGEIAYVRKVDYGRRVLVSLSAATTVEEFKNALNTSVNWATGNFKADLDQKTKRVWESTEGKLIVIGGAYPKGANAFFGGDMEALAKTIRAIMSEDFVNDHRGAVPISFELAYAADNAPMQVFETIEFAGKIPQRSWGLKTESLPVGTTGADTSLDRDDGEIDTDDWTLVEIVKQELSLSADRRSVEFELEWRALEGESNKTIGSNKTIISSGKTFIFPYSKRVHSIVAPTSIPPRQKWYAGEVHTAQRFPNHGLLSNIRVRFDGSGGQDQHWQKLDAMLNFGVWLED